MQMRKEKEDNGRNQYTARCDDVTDNAHNCRVIFAGDEWGQHGTGDKTGRKRVRQSFAGGYSMDERLHRRYRWRVRLARRFPRPGDAEHALCQTGYNVFDLNEKFA